jgi:hypothetical protein
MDWTYEVQSLARERNYIFAALFRVALGPTQLPSQGVLQSPLQGTKQLEHKADHSLVSSAKVKNVVLCPTLPYIFIVWCISRGTTLS